MNEDLIHADSGMKHSAEKSTYWLRKQARYLRDLDSGSGDAQELDDAALVIGCLESALVEIRDILPIANDEYARRVFNIAAGTLDALQDWYDDRSDAPKSGGGE